MPKGDYVVVHTVPVYVYVRGHGEIYAVHVDDERLSQPRAIIRDTTEESGFERGVDEEILTSDDEKHYKAAGMVSDWPGWELGW